MDFGKSEIQTMLLDSADRLLSETCGVEYWRQQRENPVGFDKARWAQFAEMGWLSLPLPQEAGGLDGSLEDIALLNIALGKSLATEPYVSTAVLCATIVEHCADQGLSRELLGRIAGGDLLLALAHLEHGADPLMSGPVSTSAIRTENGYRLAGRKHLALDAGSAEKFIVSASLDGEPGIALFLVEADTPGLAVEIYPLIDGTRAADLVFSDVDVAYRYRLSSGPAGANLLDEAISRAAIAQMAQAIGSMESCLRICGDYVKERKQFGVPIGSFQALQHMLSDMYLATHQARSMLYRAIALSRGSPEERTAAISAARIVVGEAGQTVSRNGIQLHGGYGVTDEYAISHHFKRLMCLEKQYGDLDAHIARFGDIVMA